MVGTRAPARGLKPWRQVRTHGHPSRRSCGPPQDDVGVEENQIMPEQAITFQSAGLKLSANVRVPDGLKAGEKRGAFLVLHGFGSNKDSSNVLAPTKVLTELGYVTLRFSMRGCGDSEGEFGRVICLGQVEETRNARDVMPQHPAVDSKRIAVVGSSFGGAVAVYAGGTNPKI